MYGEGELSLSFPVAARLTELFSEKPMIDAVDPARKVRPQARPLRLPPLRLHSPAPVKPRAPSRPQPCEQPPDPERDRRRQTADAERLETGAQRRRARVRPLHRAEGAEGDAGRDHRGE